MVDSIGNTKKRRPWCEHTLNRELIRPNEVGPVYDFLRGDPAQKQTEMLIRGENLNPNFQNQSITEFKGYVLKVAGHGFAPDSWYAGIYNTFLQEANRDARPDMYEPPAPPLAVIVRIPELTCVECPDKIGENGDHFLMDLELIFYSGPWTSSSTAAPTPGSIARVGFLSGNRTSGLYLGPLAGGWNHQAAPLGASAAYKEGIPFATPVFTAAETQQEEVISMARMLIRECGFEQSGDDTVHRKILASGEYAAVAYTAMNRRRSYLGPGGHPATITDVVYSQLRRKSDPRKKGPVWSLGETFNAKLNTALISAANHGGNARVEAVKGFAAGILSGEIQNPIEKRRSYIHLATQLKKGRKIPDWMVPVGVTDQWVIPGSGSGLLKADKRLVALGYADEVGGPITVPASSLPRPFDRKTGKPRKGPSRPPLTVGRATFV